ncbi:MAG: RibD family protein [Desulfobulbales bacterium]|nr:RibD family protein [Desulfobulbales bacterium]
MKVTLVCAATICGRISPVGYGSSLDRRRLEGIRDKTQASIMGANTLRTENPEMRGTKGVLNPERIRSVITGSGVIPVTGKKLFTHGPEPVVFTGEDKFSALEAKLEGRGRVVALPVGPHGLSLAGALDFFAARNVQSVLIEGGARLNYAALAQDVVDEIMLTVMPYVSGDHESNTLAEGPQCLGLPFLKLELLSCEPLATGEVFLHYRLKRTE